MTSREFICNALGNPNERRNNPMDLVNTQVKVNGRIYSADKVDWIQTPGEFPRVRVEATVSPYSYAAPSTRYANQPAKLPTITNVIFNPPATIVFWSDNTKTVVKCDFDQEPYDPEKGIAMAISKKMIGDNKYEYYNTFKHWLKKWDKQEKAARDEFNPTEFYI